MSSRCGFVTPFITWCSDMFFETKWNKAKELIGCYDFHEDGWRQSCQTSRGVGITLWRVLCCTCYVTQPWRQRIIDTRKKGKRQTKRQHSQSLVIAFWVDEQKCTCFHPYTLQSRIWPMQILSLFFLIMKQKLVGLRCFNGYKVCQLSVRTSWLVR